MAGTQRTVSREELYRLVWETPMARLAEEFGISGNGLAKICDRLNVPYAPRGYWAKKAAGKKVARYRLPEPREDTPAAAVITPTPPRVKPQAAVQASITEATAKVAAITGTPKEGKTHRIVKAWIASHAKEQKERARELRSRGHDRWFVSRDPIPDLTERDLYRFEVTGAYLFALEAAGAAIIEENITGRFKLRIDGETVEFVIMEKMRKGIGAPRGEAAQWTAYPSHHQTGLHASGFLRFAIPTYLGDGYQPKEWVESKTRSAIDLLPDITSRLIAAGTKLRLLEEQRQAERIEQQRRAAEEHERRRLRAIDEARWKRFCETANAWAECRHLEAFLTRVKQKLGESGDGGTEAEARSDWIAWAEEKLRQHDPERWSASEIIGQIQAAEADLPYRYRYPFS